MCDCRLNSPDQQTVTETRDGKHIRELHTYLNISRDTEINKIQYCRSIFKVQDIFRTFMKIFVV